MQTSIKRILMTGVLGFALCTFAHAQYVNNMGTLISIYYEYCLYPFKLKAYA